ncbi:MAG: hypothetical protein ACR2MD_07540 [Aridibacter sp.]
MDTFAKYYKELLKRENESQRQLIYVWRKDLIEKVETDFAQAIINSSIIGSRCPIARNASNQSVGNKVEQFVSNKINSKLRAFTIEKCKGNGYPDKTLLEMIDGDKLKQIALEMKATSKWDTKDSNRRVLTSSSKKLCENFTEPIYHLVCTTKYKRNSVSATIEGIRLDFVLPKSYVSIRLEASVSHKILDKGNHETREFPKKPV